MVRQRRLFTLDEALEILPVVRELLRQIQAAKDGLDKSSAVLEALLAMTSANGNLQADTDKARHAAELAAMELQDRIDELDGLGVDLKGIEDGLVDFPCEREGRVIYLCWRLGEETISWWHELDTGFAGRQRLDQGSV